MTVTKTISMTGLELKKALKSKMKEVEDLSSVELYIKEAGELHRLYTLYDDEEEFFLEYEV